MSGEARRTRPARWAVAAALLALPGCVYYNAIYNAERAFEEAEAMRAAGLHADARMRYGAVIDGARRGLERDTLGPWADEALFLMGRAHVRRGEWGEARRALERAARLVDTGEMAAAVRVYLGAVELETGAVERSRRMLDDGLAGVPRGPVSSDARYWRAGIRFADGEPELGWRDLEQAALDAPDLRVPATLEGVRRAVELSDTARARTWTGRLLADPEAGSVADSLRTLAERVEERWGPAVAAATLAGLESARWPRTERDPLLLVRAGLHHAAGDTTASRRDIARIAEGAGPTAVEARMRAARWTLAEAPDLQSVERLIAFLLPVEDDPGAAGLLGELRRLVVLADLGLDEPLAWFAAAEHARDRLAAPVLARGLFLAFADADPDGPWTPKALLAALAATPDEGDRAWLRGRLEGRADSPYVLAARGRSAPGFEVLEEDLARRLEELAAR